MIYAHQGQPNFVSVNQGAGGPNVQQGLHPPMSHGLPVPGMMPLQPVFNPTMQQPPPIQPHFQYEQSAGNGVSQFDPDNDLEVQHEFKMSIGPSRHDCLFQPVRPRSRFYFSFKVSSTCHHYKSGHDGDMNQACQHPICKNTLHAKTRGLPKTLGLIKLKGQAFRLGTSCNLYT